MKYHPSGAYASSLRFSDEDPDCQKRISAKKVDTIGEGMGMHLTSVSLIYQRSAEYRNAMRITNGHFLEQR